MKGVSSEDQEWGGGIRGSHHCENLRKLGLQFTRFELKVKKDIRVWSSEEVNHHRLIFLMYVTYLEKNMWRVALNLEYIK